MRCIFVSLFLLGFGIVPVALAQTPSLSSGPIAVGVVFTGQEVSYGDLIIFDAEHNLYTLSQKPDDSRVYGVAQENPPVVIYEHPSDLTVVRQGRVLVNVTMENGPISQGDGLISSSITGKAMRAASSSLHLIGVAVEAFTGASTSTSLTLQGKTIPAGTILVDLSPNLGAGTRAGLNNPAQGIDCTAGTFTCTILQKINAAPLITLTRYLIAAAVSLGSLYLAFRSFVSDAVNGVISVGRNPRAKGSIQAMVAFNAILAGVIAAAGLGVGLLILFVKI